MKAKEREDLTEVGWQKEQYLLWLLDRRAALQLPHASAYIFYLWSPLCFLARYVKAFFTQCFCGSLDGLYYCHFLSFSRLHSRTPRAVKLDGVGSVCAVRICLCILCCKLRLPHLCCTINYACCFSRCSVCVWREPKSFQKREAGIQAATLATKCRLKISDCQRFGSLDYQRLGLLRGDA